MTNLAASSQLTASRTLLVGIVLLALNLRLALASIGPLAEEIHVATGLSMTAVGWLTTLPLLAFAAVSAVAAGLIGRLGIERAGFVALALITIGTGLRAVGAPAALFAGTLLMGLGVAGGNVLLPALVRRSFSERAGAVTGLYSATLSGGATLAAGASVPLAVLVGWRWSLGSWAVGGVLAMAYWAYLISRRRLIVPMATASARVAAPDLTSPSTAGGGAIPTASVGYLLRSPTAWSIALFMGFQSLTYYVVLAWLPSLLHDRGFDPASAGWLLGLSQATGVAGALLVPWWAGRSRRQAVVLGALVVGEAIALAGLLLPTGGHETALVGLLGLVLGGAFGYALYLLATRAPDAATATLLSGAAQSVGYLVAAAGPPLIGYLHVATGAWAAALYALIAALVLKLLAGLRAVSGQAI